MKNVRARFSVCVTDAWLRARRAHGILFLLFQHHSKHPYNSLSFNKILIITTTAAAVCVVIVIGRY